ncbi:YeiH family protein [Bisbaumannia pacifica]|uniref:Sulfate exporter family transporter n=1 Tax=Bisbaumannia pacifica TaxID=77098 RepID=A0ABD4KY51_9GAMM|nr:putative sulfate exporter family transporter [Halomonas pacifica]MBH8579375.1 putative sulfate exporter family transporter [Halomonas pacifica]
MLPGLLISGLLAAAGLALAALPPLAERGISPLVIALLLGMVAGNLALGRRLGDPAAGLAFATRRLLRAGIVLFGLSLTLQQLFALGPWVVVLDLLIMITVLTLGYQLGTRWLGLDRETALLTSTGSAICGAAAILATESTIRARPAATAMAVATVVLFGSLAMLLYPLLYPFSGMSEGLFGIYIGATLHEVAQVVAAGEAVGPEALANALVVKLLRVMLLVPFLLLLARHWRRPSGHPGTPSTAPVPWFAFGFVAMVGVNSLVSLPPALHHGLVELGRIALTLAMAALGYETRLDRLRALGLRPLLLAAILFLLLLSLGWLASLLLLG